MAEPRSAPSLDTSRVARIPLATTQASIAAGEQAVAWLAAISILNTDTLQRCMGSVAAQAPRRFDALRADEAPVDALAGLAARQRNMAFALSLMSFHVGLTWLLRFSEALRD